MRSGILLWILWLLIAGVGCAQAFQLAYKDTPGTVRWYRTQVVFYGSFTTQPMNKITHLNGTVGFTLVEKVLAVGTDGLASIQAKISDGSLFVNLPDLDQPPITVPIPALTVNYKRSPAGKISEIAIEGLPASITGMPGMNLLNELKMFSQAGTGLEFPTGMIQAGDSWTNDTSIEIMGQKLAIQRLNTLRGPRVVHQASYLQIDSTVTMKAPALTFQLPTGGKTVTIHEALDTSVKATTLFDATAGEMFSTWLDGDSHFTITGPRRGTDETVTTTGTIHISGGMSKIAPPRAMTAR